MPPTKSKSRKPSRPSKSSAGSDPKSARRQLQNSLCRTAKQRRERPGKLFEDLVAVQARLRAPGGCPWDREQTHASLRTYLIEEAYEVLDAIEKGDAREMAEELGDLLLQILFHADLAREARAFDISDVILGIHNKMIRRHPHVFGNVKAETAGEVLKNWAKLKAIEKQSKVAGHEPAPTESPSILEGVPRNLPALLEAYQMTRRAAQVGFDWKQVEGILEKLNEETGELRAALGTSDSRAAQEELGDILFSVVNLARFLKVDPEVALKYSNLKFKVRFQEMEREVARSGRQLSQLSDAELDQLWVGAKTKTRAELSGKFRP